MKKHLLCLILFIALISCEKPSKKKLTIHRKQTPKEVVKETVIPVSREEADLLKLLIDEEIRETKTKEFSLNLKESPCSVTLFESKGIFSTIYFSIIASGDINNDGIIDYLVDKNSEGVNGEFAGTANIYQDFVFLIMKDKKNVDQQHYIFGYTTISDNILTEPKYKDKKINLIATQNPASHSSLEEMKSTNLSFSYKNGNVYEDSYLTKCELAKLKSKTIFNPIENVTKRKRSIDAHNYTETIEETYQVKDTLVQASLSGCDNRTFEFQISMPSTKIQSNDKVFKKNSLVAIFGFLSKNTQFPQDMNPIVDYLRENEITDENSFKIDGNLDCEIFIRKYENKQMLIFITIERQSNPNQTENWEIVTRNKLPRPEA